MLFAPTAFFLRRPFYEANGKLRVSPVIQAFISRNKETSITSYYGRFVQTQVDRIKEPEIIEKAIDRLPPNLKRLFKPDNLPLHTAAKIVGGRLEATQLRGTHLIEIKLTRGSPTGLADIINNIMEVYIDEYQREEEGKDSRRLSYLLKEKKRLESEIAEQAGLLQKISKEIATSAFFIKDDQPSQFQAAYESAYRTRVEKENTLKTVTKEAEALKQLSLDAYVEEMVEKNVLLSQLDILTQQSLHELRDARFGMAEDNPGRKQVDDRIREILKYTDEQRGTIKEKTRQLFYEKREAELQEKIIRAEAEFEAAKRTEEDILKERNLILTERARISPKILIRKQVESNLEQMRTLLNRIDARFHELKLESKAPGRISLESRATRPGAPAGNNLKKLLALIFIFTFGSITSVCVLFDILDTRVRSDKDILNGLGTSPHRHILDYLSVGSKNVPFSRVTLDDPTNTVSKSIHSLAIRLDKERKEHDAKVVVFTGVDSRSGVTGILLNSAHAISRLCPRVLIIEANFANPVLDRLIKENKEQKGLVDFLMGQTLLPDCIVHDRERGIDLLLAGHLPTNDELVMLDRSKIPQALEEFKKEYDFILVDTIPIMVSDLTEFFIIQADVVPLVIQGDRCHYRHLYMAGQVLMKLEVPAIAAVMNWGAPRYKTRVQKIVFKMLWPIQKRLSSILSRSLYPTMPQPNSSSETSGHPIKETESKSTDTPVINIKQIKKLSPAKYQIGVHLFILFAILLAAAIFLFKGKADLPSKQVVNQTIKPVEQRPPALTSGRKNQDSQKRYALLPDHKFSSKGGQSNGPEETQKALMVRPSDFEQGGEGYSVTKDSSVSVSGSNLAEKAYGLQRIAYKSEAPIVNVTDGRPNSIGIQIKRNTDTPETYEGKIKQEDWILDQDPELYTIQLSGSIDKQLLLKFARSHALGDNVAYYHKYYKGRDWYALIYGLYPGWSKAMEALKNLPESLYKSSPWVRRISSIQKSINMKGLN